MENSLTFSQIDKPSLEFLEIMAIRGCNLSCQGCTTFSDLRHAGYATWETGKQWIEPWISRLDIQAIGLMGGEPLMNPELSAWLIGLRKLLPKSQIRFVTNGLLLEKHWDILNLLDDLGNCVFKISYHVADPKLDAIISKILADRVWEPITEFGINRWISSTGLRFQISKPAQFLKTFRGNYENMLPHNNLPARAFDICVQKKCPLLYQGKIWKCGTLALTPELLDRMGRPNYDQWIPFLDPGLASDCNGHDLDNFVKNFGYPNNFCRQCPSQLNTDSLIDHLTTVKFK
jgi:hypothetical protein